MRRGRRTPWAAVAASAAVNLLLFIVLAWAQVPPKGLPKPEAYGVREIFQAAPPPPDVVEVPETPAVAETTPTVVEPAPLDPAPPAESFDARLDLPRFDLPMPSLPVPSIRSDVAGPSGSAGPVAVSRVDQAPRRVSAPLPPYPSWARLRRLEGVVTLRMVVRTDGSVYSAEVERVDGDPRFGEIARETVLRWTFDPAMRNGRPVDCILLQRVRFDLVDQ